MLNVLFAGSPECSAIALEAVARSHRVVAVLTNPPAPQGRSLDLVPTPVEATARRLIAEGVIARGTPILAPAKITQDVRDAIAIAKPDAMACFAYGKIFGPKTLALFPLGALNLHPSLLPRWRGCAPVPAAILARDAETGVTIQKMALEMDSGDIVMQERIPLDGRETSQSLLDKAARIGAPLLAEALDRLERGAIVGVKQDESKATYCAMLRKDDGEIDWNEKAADIDARIRAFHPWPGAFTESGPQTLLIHGAHVFGGTPPDSAGAASRATGPGSVLGIDRKEGILVQTGEGILALECLQWRAKKPLDWKSFMNGSRDFIFAKLGKNQ
jgi:methionyl-tRNA formyltransferase